MTRLWSVLPAIVATMGLCAATARAQCDPCGVAGACDTASYSACYNPCGPYDACGTGCGGGLLGGELGDPWKAFEFGPCSPWDVGGWIQVGYHTQGRNTNPNLPAGPIVGTGLFNNYPNNVQLQQAWLYAERAADTGGCGLDWGFRADFVYGTDGQDTQAFGGVPNSWDTGWDNGVAYGSALPQLYGTVAYNDISVKVGHFYTIIGYEVVGAPDNFFYSHSRSMVLTEPFTHTGALAEWTVNENVTAWGGWTAGWDTGFDGNNGNTFLGGLSLQLTDNLAFTYATTIGNFGFGANDGGYMHSLVFDWAVTDRLNYVLQSDFISNNAFVANYDPNADTIWSINQYALYTINDRWAAGARVEWWVNEDLSAVNGAHDIFDITLGVNYRPHANFVLRPEVRWDIPGTGLQTLGYVESPTFGIDCVMTF